MNTPFLSKTLQVFDDPIYNMKASVFFIDADSCRWDCEECSCRGIAPKRMLSVDSFIKETKRYELLQTELFIVRGGETTFIVSDLEAYLQMLKNITPVRIHTNGQRTTALERLKTSCDGFRVDLKIPIQESYSTEERDFCHKVVRKLTCPYAYRDALRESIKCVDGMEHTYFTCSAWGLFTVSMKKETLNFLNSFKSPILMGGEFKKRVNG